MIWLALVLATTLGFARMIAVQPAFYTEPFGARVRYTGFAAAREITAAISFVAFFLSKESKDVDIAQGQLSP